MTDAPLDLSIPSASEKPASSTAPRVQNDLLLVPPAPVPNIGTQQASSMMPIDATRTEELTARAHTFIADLVDHDPKAPEFLKKVADVSALGRDEIRGAAEVTNRLLERPVAALAAARGNGGRSGCPAPRREHPRRTADEH